MSWRISVIGTAGCGKTTLAKELSRRLNIPHVELDGFHWGPNWTPMPNATFLEQVDVALKQENWVMDGNYIRVRFDTQNGIELRRFGRAPSYGRSGRLAMSPVLGGG